FGAASLSKPVFAYLVLKLIESGKYNFDLNTKLNDILPFDQFCIENNLNWEKTDTDTINRVKLLNAKMVLSHTTGFNLFKQVPIKSQFEPGKGYVYSNLAMFYLQKVIEKLAHLSLQTLAKTYVFDPIGMNHSSFYRDYALD